MRPPELLETHFNETYNLDPDMRVDSNYEKLFSKIAPGATELTQFKAYLTYEM